MGDYAIRMQFDIDASAEVVRNALTSVQGISAWWSSRVAGSPDRDDGRLEVSFPDVPVPFDFAVSLGEQIRWTTGAIPEWWHGTWVSWEMEPNPDGEGTRLHLVHGGFNPESPIIEVVTPAWADIVSRLKAYAESGERRPFSDF
jgi:uncharacterized protein YndB with AHSA1/START domain